MMEVLSTGAHNACQCYHETAYSNGKLHNAPASLVLLQIGGYWSSGLPYLDASFKTTKRPWEAGLQLPLMMLNISEVQVGRL